MLSQDEEQQGQTEGLQTTIPSGGGVPQGDGLPLASATMTQSYPNWFCKNLMVTSGGLGHFGIDLIAWLIRTLAFHL